ncbi:Ig-like domain-containing protein [Nocardiopsis sp. CT-R113]|uniref:Ig-like domain-containing protein n=1 Tax=Nocardiopsis codii TaxID=3065942 RepID=A0ABU7KDR8_9ACTN|nr:Ig-like domain-containing protein [Nocardiopsis sp. CT-R113]MEE2040177.1 Ig-like domain-containing protein [Nocardiopsis sp. CT-R113]
MATQQLTATLTLTDGTAEPVTSTATWTSSDEAVATVSTAGLVTAVGPGECTVTASHSGLSGTSTITVPEPTPEALAVSPASATVDLD